MNPIGQILYNLYPFIFIKSEEEIQGTSNISFGTGLTDNIDKLKLQVFNYLLSLAVITGVLFTLVLVTFFEKFNFLEFELTETEREILLEEKNRQQFQQIGIKTQITVL
jgi:hypothetical protein